MQLKLKVSIYKKKKLSLKINHDKFKVIECLSEKEIKYKG